MLRGKHNVFEMSSSGFRVQQPEFESGAHLLRNLLMVDNTIPSRKLKFANWQISRISTGRPQGFRERGFSESAMVAIPPMSVRQINYSSEMARGCAVRRILLVIDIAAFQGQLWQEMAHQTQILAARVLHSLCQLHTGSNGFEWSFTFIDRDIPRSRFQEIILPSGDMKCDPTEEDLKKRESVAPFLPLVPSTIMCLNI